MIKQYEKYEGREDNLQIAAARFLDILGVHWLHIANERHTSPQRGAKLKKMGVKSGACDIFILEPRGDYHGLFIELKVKGGRLSDNQKEFIDKSNERNYKTVVCWSIDELIDTVEDYLKSKKPLFCEGFKTQ